MSLILEALRKSEAERQLGRAPGLLTPMPMPRRERRVGRTLALGLPLLVAVAIGGWWLGRGGDVGLPGGTTPGAAEPPAALEPPAMRPTHDIPPTAPSADTAATPSATTASSGDVATRSERPPAPRDLAPRDAAARTIPPASEPAAAVAPAPEPATAAARAATPTTPPVAPPEATTNIAEPTDPAPADPAPATASAHAEPALPGLDSVDAARRAALPPLRISLHMYNEDPAQRFVLIDGRRYGQGQAIDAAVQVSEIRRDGVVLAIDGRDVLLRRP